MIPKLMGIVNLTEDSFYPNSRALCAENFNSLAQSLETADIIDLGAESSRPYATPVPAKTQLIRLEPAIKALQTNYHGQISIDTSEPEVMQYSIELGIDMINDIRALSKPGALEVIAQSSVTVCLTHMQGSPENMQDNPYYPRGVMQELKQWCYEVTEKCLKAGIKKDNIILDPGFGFGKTIADNWIILEHLEELTKEHKILIGVSNKSMFQNIIGCKDISQRSLPSRVAEAIATIKNVHMIRTHDAIATKKAIMVAKYQGV